MNDSDVAAAVIISMTIFRFIAILVCNEKAKKMNRSADRWVILSVLAPIIAVIWIYFIKPIKGKEQMKKLA